MAWYDTGTVNVANGSTAVVGVGTNFIAGAQVGEGFYGPDNRLYEIQAIVSATSLTLADVYLGTTQTGQGYKIVPTQSLVAALATQVSTLISDFQGVVDESGSGKFDDGTATSAGITFTLDQDTGIFRPAANQIGFTTAGVERVKITNAGIDVAGDAEINGSLTVQGSTGSIFLTDTDVNATARIWQTGENLYIDNQSALGGDTFFRTDNGKTRQIIRDNGDVSWRDTAGTSEDLYWDASTSRLGLGTTNPSATLDVVGDVIVSGSLHLRDEVLGKVVTYTPNQNAPYMIAGSTSYTGATTNWGTYGYQHRFKADSNGVARVTIDSISGEAFYVESAGSGNTVGVLGTLEVVGEDATINGITVGRGAGDVSTNTASGYQALAFNTTGASNTASGYRALYNNTTGGENTANGREALLSNTTGNGNTASGYQALIDNTTGSKNIASGYRALFNNTTGGNNTASGYQALAFNTTGINNTASGYRALYNNTTGNNNAASGYEALLSNTEGDSNTASGRQALYNNLTGGQNTASGMQALYNNITGGSNTANGRSALLNNTTGGQNTAVGFQALLNNTTGSGNTAINPRTGAVAYAPVFDPTTENNRFCMGSTAVTNAYIQVAWTVVSDKRDKTEMRPVPHGLDFVKELKPTSFRYKADRADTEGHGVTRYGFLAQDILALEGDNPVIIDNEDPEKLRMTDQSLIAVLVNAIQDQQKIIETLEGRITALENN